MNHIFLVVLAVGKLLKGRALVAASPGDERNASLRKIVENGWIGCDLHKGLGRIVELPVCEMDIQLVAKGLFQRRNWTHLPRAQRIIGPRSKKAAVDWRNDSVGLLVLRNCSRNEKERHHHCL